MKKVTSLKKGSDNRKIVKRKGCLRIINKLNPKFKQKKVNGYSFRYRNSK